MNKFDLTGKTAIVTGGAGLLGKYFCYALADFGANIVVADINKQGAQLLAKELEIKKDIKSIGIYCDVASPDSYSVTRSSSPVLDSRFTFTVSITVSSEFKSQSTT